MKIFNIFLGYSIRYSLSEFECVLVLFICSIGLDILVLVEAVNYYSVVKYKNTSVTLSFLVLTYFVICSYDLENLKNPLNGIL